MAKYMNDAEAKAAIIDFGKRIYARGLVGGNEGNITCRVGTNEVWCTPTMESKGYMTEDMLIKMDLDGKILEGTYKPSSEVKMHLGVMKESEEVQAVCHAHPCYATAFAASGIEPDGKLLPEGMFLFGEKINIAEFAAPGTYEVPNSVIPFVKDNCVCLVGNHGALSWGKSLKEAYFFMETLENYCKILMLNKYVLKSTKPIPGFQAEKILAQHKEIIKF